MACNEFKWFMIMNILAISIDNLVSSIVDVTLLLDLPESLALMMKAGRVCSPLLSDLVTVGLTQCGLATLYGVLIAPSDWFNNSLSPFGANPLTQPMLTYCKLNPQEPIAEKFE